jgi:uncharacterized surface protein with fasciclin (FAS1) repeats
MRQIARSQIQKALVLIAVFALVGTPLAMAHCGACGSGEAKAEKSCSKAATCDAKQAKTCDKAATCDTKQAKACPAGCTKACCAEKEAKTIVDVADEAGAFKTLLVAAKAAGLDEVLMGEGPFTVFAPTDEAFKKLPEGTLEELLDPENKEKLVAILQYHVVAGEVMAEDVVKVEEAETVLGQNIKVAVSDEGEVSINDAKVLQTDIEADNGIIHVIDTVILPAG